MPVRKVSVEDTPGKPSLASLKPDKTKGDAAKKRAVKRIVSSASKKSSAIRIKSISDNIARTTPKKKIVNKTVKEKEQPISISTKKTSKLPTKTAGKKVDATLHKRPAPALPQLTRKDPIVKLPSNMSIRAREKALVILESVLDDFEKPAERISLVSGLCFVLVGSYLALSFSGLVPGSTQAAQLALQTAGTTTDISQTETVQNVTQESVFKALDTLPPHINANAQYTFSFTNVKNVSVQIYSLDTGNRTTLAVEKLLESTYRYTIEGSKLTAGTYVVKVYGESVFTTTRYNHELGRFTVPALTTEAETTDETVNTSEATAQTITNTASEVDAVTTEEITPDDEANATEANDEEAIDAPVPPPPTTTSRLRLVVPSELKGQTVLKLYAPSDTRFVELYARPIKSINSRLLGLAEKQGDAWYYFFNTVNVPNGDYELYGRTRLGDAFVQSNSVNTTVSNPTTITPTAPLPETKTTTERVAEAPANEPQSADTVEQEETAPTQAEVDYLDVVATPVRTFSEAAFENASSSEADPMVTAQADGIFSAYADPLRDMLRRYAVAVQSGDVVLLRTIETEIAKLKSDILGSVLADSTLNDLADNISLEFDGRLEGLKKRINTFEELRRSAGAEDVGLDTDGDGITDYDENNLYRTDAREADSDNDGVTDGIEIIKGFDPRSPAGEVAVEYELPQDTIGLEDTEVLRVDAVFPSVKETGETKVVQSEIRGKSLPNSFVTLYIFSAPTIVTVRTDAEGTFVYTFEKELEDGEHEVYAAVTDNSGAIIAHSKPFRFIKQAEAFTPIDAAGEEVTSLSSADQRQFDLYKIVIGLGLLSLGIVLMMLGLNLRHTRAQVLVRDDIKPA